MIYFLSRKKQMPCAIQILCGDYQSSGPAAKAVLTIRIYVTAEAVTHKDNPLITQAKASATWELYRQF
jgi:hypothetical protein